MPQRALVRYLTGSANFRLLYFRLTTHLTSGCSKSGPERLSQCWRRCNYSGALRAVQPAISSDGVNESPGKGRCARILMKLSSVASTLNFTACPDREKKNAYFMHCVSSDHRRRNGRNLYI